MNPNPGSLLEELFRLAPLYAIWDTQFRLDLHVQHVVESWLKAGVRVIQYRHKAAFQRINYKECCALADRVRSAGGCFFVNDRADIAELCEAAGVHLGQEDLPVDKARKFLSADRLIGYSTHNVEQAHRAAESSADYIAIGPVFITSTKENPDPVVGLEMITRVRSITQKPLVAIGGISRDNAASVLQAGANAVAVIRDLVSASDTEKCAREFISELKK
ncbi:MAG: thiamine-phosphate diphosphorylase [Acidobacteria bacterium RIFCSPLOWO2_12_FULL_54_10]|nr:MAG: thiamine-phosphate diphosphorylase [Acidobacteria bacterium RIFCSPLOWO2_12_FULL_54_10]